MTTALGAGPAAGLVRSAGCLIVWAIWLTAAAGRADGQVYQVEAGTSTLFNASGGTLEARTADSSVQVGAGRVQDRWTLGALFRKTVRGVSLGVGDGIVNFDLPSDLFGGGHYVQLRGARADWVRGPTTVAGFAGVTSTTLGAPYFRGGTWGRPLGMLFADRVLTPQWRVFSRNAFSTHPTSIQGAEWTARPFLKVAAVGGVGNSQLYGSASATIDYRWLAAKAAYSSAASGFRRVAIDSPSASEVEHENVSVTVRPGSLWSVNFARQNIVQDATADRQRVRVRVNQIGGNLNGGGWRLASSLFDSTGADRSSLGSSLTVARAVTRSLDVSADYFRYAPRGDSASSSGVLTVRKTINPRFSLLQVVTQSGRQTSYNVGGELLSNVLSMTVSYQTIYAPLRTGDPFVRVLGVDLRINGPGGVELRAGTYATPDGRLKYTISGRQLLSRAGRDRARAQAMARFEVRGVVVDPEARPVAGAVLRIGQEVVITDDDGRFMFRTNKNARLEIAVLTDEFLGPGRFEVVSAPAGCQPEDEKAASDVTIVVRRG